MMKSDPSNVHASISTSEEFSSELTRRDSKHMAASMSQICSIDPKQFWRWVNSIEHHCNPLLPLQPASGVVNDNSTKANVFNQQLSFYQ